MWFSKRKSKELSIQQPNPTLEVVKAKVSPLKRFEIEAKHMSDLIDYLQKIKGELLDTRELPDPKEWQVVAQTALSKAKHAEMLVSIVKAVKEDGGLQYNYMRKADEAIKKCTDAGYFTTPFQLSYSLSQVLRVLKKSDFKENTYSHMYGVNKCYTQSELVKYYTELAKSFNLYMVLLKIAKKGYVISYDPRSCIIFITIDVTQPDCLQVEDTRMAEYNKRQDIKRAFKCMKKNAQALIKDFPEYVAKDDKVNFFMEIFGKDEDEQPQEVL